MPADLPLDKWYDAIMGEIVAVMRDEGKVTPRVQELRAQLKRELPDRYRKAGAAEKRRYLELQAKVEKWMQEG